MKDVDKVESISSQAQQAQLQTELANAQNMLQTILDAMPAPVYSKRYDGQYLFVNEEFLKNVKMNVTNPIGKTDYELFGPETAQIVRVNDERVMREKKRLEILEEVPHPDGSIRLYVSYKFPTFDQNQNVHTVTGISFDVTEKVRIQKELEIERSRLIQASKMSSLGEMAGGIAHEINNPLAIIKGYSLRLRSLFFESDHPIANRASQITEDILRAVDRTNKIIRGLRNFSRDASHEKLQTVCLKKLVVETVGLCRARFSELHVKLVKELDPNIRIECHEIQISQVILNLLSNALDATVEAQVEGDKRKVLIRTFYNPSEAKAIIQVLDHGCGFRDGINERYFEPFFSTKEPGKGTGLGLSISQSLIKKHKGKISISSHRDPTIVTVELPGWVAHPSLQESVDA